MPLLASQHEPEWLTSPHMSLTDCLDNTPSVPPECASFVGHCPPLLGDGRLQTFFFSSPQLSVSYCLYTSSPVSQFYFSTDEAPYQIDLVVFRFLCWRSFRLLSLLQALQIQMNPNSFWVFSLPLHFPWCKNQQLLISMLLYSLWQFILVDCRQNAHKQCMNAQFDAFIGHVHISGPEKGLI